MSDNVDPKPFLVEDMVINYTPIVYNSDTDFTKVSNVLLVDTDVQDYNKFVEGCNSSTFPIVFSRSSNKGEIADLLASKLPSISRIAIVANNSSISTNNKSLFNYKPYFLESDLTEGATTYSENLQFLIYLINTHSVKNIDYLSCYSLNYDSWKEYYGVLTKETGVTVGASSDKTGNLKYGGDWVMESTGVDVEAIYFSESISGYQGTLDTNNITTSGKLYMNALNTKVAYSTDNGATKTEITWPCTLSGTITVTLAEDLTVDANNCYFIISNGNNVTLEGGNHTVTVNGVTGYQGLVRSRSTSTVVQNLGVLTSSGSTLAENAGWVGWGDVEHTYSFYGNISNCYSTGDMRIQCGGIVGMNAGSINGSCNINNCYSTGIIGMYFSGGIAGSSAGSSGSCTIINCYSTGAIDGPSSGGIAASSAGNSGICTISNCYSTGNISQTYSGGIAGNGAASNSGICNISNCYTTGYIGSFGTFGSGVLVAVATGATISNSFGTNGTPWSDTTASSNLVNPLTDSSWKLIFNNTPWKLAIFLKDAVVNYNSGTLVYTNNYPISAYSNALQVKILNNNITYDGPTVTLSQKSVTINSLNNIDTSLDTYLLLYNGSTLVSYADRFLTTNTTTTTTTSPPETTTTTTTTSPPATTTLSTSCSLYMNSGNVAYSTDNGVTKTNIIWPCTLTGTITVTLAQDLTLSSTACYFIISDGNSVTLEGGNYTITVNGVTGYPGLVESNDNDTIVQNLGVLSINLSVINGSNGWIGRNGFNGTIQNCYSNGNVTGSFSGGIAGRGVGNNGNCTISNCYSTGAINGSSSGGIVGSEAVNCNITNCYSTGDIYGELSGGIIGANAGSNSGSFCTIRNCYSTGNITNSSINSGGIAGSFAGNYGGSCIIEKCYSTGAINGNDSGGIVGRSCNCTITICYTTGTIGGIGSGGIVASYAGTGNNMCTVNNCYTLGDIISNNCGGIIGNNAGNSCTINNCYTTGSINSGVTGSDVLVPVGSVANVNNSFGSNGIAWNDTIASSNLVNIPNANIWKLIFTNTPWKIAIFLKDAVANYNSGTLVYTNNYPISAYSNALQVKILNNNITYDGPTVTLSQKSVTVNSLNNIDTSLDTYLLLYNGSTLVSYADRFLTTNTTTTTTTLPPETTTTTTTTLPPETTTTTTTTSPPETTTTTTTTLPPETTTTTTTTLPPETTTTTTTTIPIIRVTRVTLNKTAITIKTKATYRLIANISPTNATNKAVRWFSSNTKIAKVNTSGVVTAVGPGKANIVVTTVDGGYIAISTITVVQPVTGVRLNFKNSTIKVNSSKKLIATILPANATDKRVTLSSSNTKVATVNSSGVIKAKNISGTAKITVKTVSGGYKETATIKVTRTQKDILLANSTISTNSSNNSTVEFSIDADYNTLLDVDTEGLADPVALEAYTLALIEQILAKTDISIDNIEILNISSGSIVNEISIPTEYVAGLQYVVQSGNFEITLNGFTYPAIASSFKIINNICFHKGTMILTPSGYRAVETINSGDVVTTAQDRIVKVRKVTSFTGTTEKCPLYVLHKDSLGTNMPLTDLYMSEGHAYRHNGQWCHMKCSSAAMKLDLDDIEYYNIVLDNYLENTLVANGVEVESLFNMKGLEMTWNCGKDNCKPVIAVKKQL